MPGRETDFIACENGTADRRIVRPEGGTPLARGRGADEEGPSLYSGCRTGRTLKNGVLSVPDGNGEVTVFFTRADSAE